CPGSLELRGTAGPGRSGRARSAARAGRAMSNSEPNPHAGSLNDVDVALPATVHAATFADNAVVSASFEQFYRAHRAAVGRALAVTLRDAELASDAVDEAMARAYERWPHVSPLENPVGWVYRVGLNWSRSLLRRSRRAAPMWISPSATTVDRVGVDPAIDRALGELSVDQRAVVVCRLLA